MLSFGEKRGSYAGFLLPASLSKAQEEVNPIQGDAVRYLFKPFIQAKRCHPRAPGQTSVKSIRTIAHP